MKLIDRYRVTLTGLLVCTLSAYGHQGSNNVEQRVNNILNQMTLDEKLSYIGGTGFLGYQTDFATRIAGNFYGEWTLGYY